MPRSFTALSPSCCVLVLQMRSLKTPRAVSLLPYAPAVDPFFFFCCSRCCSCRRPSLLLLLAASAAAASAAAAVVAVVPAVPTPLRMPAENARVATRMLLPSQYQVYLYCNRPAPPQPRLFHIFLSAPPKSTLIGFIFL